MRLGPIVLAALLVGGCGAAPRDQARQDAVPVSVAAVAQRDVPLELRAIGTVVPAETVAVKAQVEGQLAEVRFEEGQEVRRDDLLFVIDPRPFEAAVREAEANLARHRAEAANATREAERFARLIREGIVSPDEYEQARTKAQSLAAAATADEAAVENARIRLHYCTIRSPIDGRIGKVLVHRGNVIKENDTTLAVINQVRPAAVEFTLPQQDLPVVRRYMADGVLAVEAFPPGDDGRSVAGELRFLNNAVDTTTGTVLLKAVFPNPDETLWPGQFVNVALRLATQRDALVVPARAVQAGQAGPFVYVVKPDATVEARPVTTGRGIAEDVTVTEGLAAGETVVTDGQLRLAPGMRVEGRPQPGATAQHVP